MAPLKWRLFKRSVGVGSYEPTPQSGGSFPGANETTVALKTTRVVDAHIFCESQVVSHSEHSGYVGCSKNRKFQVARR